MEWFNITWIADTGFLMAPGHRYGTNSTTVVMVHKSWCTKPQALKLKFEPHFGRCHGPISNSALLHSWDWAMRKYCEETRLLASRHTIRVSSQKQMYYG